MIVLFFCVFEIILRLFIPQNDHFYQSDSILGSSLIPNKEGVWAIEGETIPIQINSHGFRGWDYLHEKSENSFRIAILGDSYIEAFQVSEEKMFGSKLENALNQLDNGMNYEVLSFGVSGYGTIQEYLMFNDRIKQFEPDLVVLAITGGNDIRNNLFSLENEPQKPYFSINNDDLELIEPVISDSVLKDINKYLLNYFHSYRFLTYRFYRVIALQNIKDESDIPIDYFVYGCDYNDEWNNAWDITKTTIIKLENDVQATGNNFLILNLTSYMQTHEEEGLELVMEQYPAMKDMCWDINKPNSILEQFVNESSIPYLDLLPIFIEKYHTDYQETHFESDGHWNELGHELASDVLYNFLIENSYIQP